MNIVPLYIRACVPRPALRVLCMPFLGGTTLARLLDVLGHTGPSGPGRQLVEALDRSQARLPVGLQAGGPVAAVPRPGFLRPGDLLDRRLPGRRPPVRPRPRPGAHGHQAVQHPPDGRRPADAPRLPPGRGPDRRRTSPPPTGSGGTPGYMSPEQEATVAAMDTGWWTLVGGRARSDVYSLGCVLAEMLGADAHRRPIGDGHDPGRSVPRCPPGWRM